MNHLKNMCEIRDATNPQIQPSDQLDQIFDYICIEKTLIQPPPPCIILCGGPCDINKTNNFSSAREALYSSEKLKEKKYYKDIILPEGIFKFFQNSDYSDLLEFERDLAYFSTLTIVIPEGPGSIAELGAFSILKEINQKLAIILHDDYKQEGSFIVRGPISHIKSLKDESVITMWWTTKDTNHEENFSEIDDTIETLDSILTATEPPQKFSSENQGHILFLLLEILKFISLANLKEILAILKKIKPDISQKELKKKLQLLTQLSLISEHHYQNQTYYIVKKETHKFADLYDTHNNRLDIMRIKTSFSSFYNTKNRRKAKAYRKYLNSQSTS